MKGHLMDVSKVRKAALLLSIFLGVIGADSFYLKDYKRGLIKLFTIGGLYIFQIIDIYRIATNTYPNVNFSVTGDDNNVPLPNSSAIENLSSFKFSVVGESFYQDELEEIFEEHGDGERAFVGAYLTPEDDNEYDKNAVAVVVNQKIIGHLSKTDAKKYHSSFKPYRVCRVVVGEGSDESNGNIWVKVFEVASVSGRCEEESLFFRNQFDTYHLCNEMQQYCFLLC